jgi:hypothetical protein
MATRVGEPSFQELYHKREHMKFIGFYKDYHLDNNNLLILPQANFNEMEKVKILEYLKFGKQFAVELRVINSLIDNSIIGALSYYTDGEFIWPSYLIYYVDHLRCKLPIEFIDKALNFEMIDSNSQVIEKAAMDEAISFYNNKFEKFILHLAPEDFGYGNIAN